MNSEKAPVYGPHRSRSAPNRLMSTEITARLKRKYWERQRRKIEEEGWRTAMKGNVWVSLALISFAYCSFSCCLSKYLFFFLLKQLFRVFFLHLISGLFIFNLVVTYFMVSHHYAFFYLQTSSYLLLTSYRLSFQPIPMITEYKTICTTSTNGGFQLLHVLNRKYAVPYPTATIIIDWILGFFHALFFYYRKMSVTQCNRMSSSRPFLTLVRTLNMLKQ